MSFLSRLFGRGASKPKPKGTEERLEELEAQAEKAASVYVGTAFNRAGDVARKDGQTDRAIAYYGRAIDALLKDGQREAARGVANKIIRVRPRAVRTLCTLTWLDLAARHSATALLHLRDYVEAAKEIDRRGLAASQIYEMARIVPESEFVGAVADALDGLDFPLLADEVRGWVKQKGSPDAIEDPGELAAACLRAAVHSNERGDRGIGDEPEPEAADAADAKGEEGAEPEAVESGADAAAESAAGAVAATEKVVREAPKSDVAEAVGDALETDDEPLETAVDAENAVDTQVDEVEAADPVDEPVAVASASAEAAQAESPPVEEPAPASLTAPEGGSAPDADEATPATGEKAAPEEEAAASPSNPKKSGKKGKKRKKKGKRKKK